MALPTVGAEGCWIEAEDKLARAIADCPRTWNFLGVPDAAGATSGNMWIHYMDPPRDGEEYSEQEWKNRHPGIVIGSAGNEAGVVQLFRRSVPKDFGVFGEIIVSFYAFPDTAHENIPDQDRVFLNDVWKILEELTDRTDREGFVWLRTIEVMEFGREKPEGDVELGKILALHASCSWGDTEGGDEG